MKTNTPEKYFINQLLAHQCQLPPSDDYQYVRQLKKAKNFFLISEKSLESYLKAKSLSGIYYEKRRQVRTTNVIIHPLSKFRKMWIIWMSFVLLLSFIFLPFFSAFHGPVYAKQLYKLNRPFFKFWFVLYTVFVIRLANLVDVIVNFFTGYVTETPEEMVIQPWRILRDYLLTYFLFDVASSLPLDFSLVMVLGLRNYSNLKMVHVMIMALLPYLKFFRLYTFYKYWSVVFSLFSSSEAKYNVFCVTALFFLIIHWSSCATVLISQFMYYDRLFKKNYAEKNDSWIFETNLFEKSLGSMYVCALYRTVTCVTRLGFELFSTARLEDKIISAILGIFGAVYLLVLLVIFVQSTSGIARAKTSYSEVVEQVNEYMEFKKFPKALRKKVREYYLCLYQKHVINEHIVLKLASDNLRKEILLRMYQRLIEKVNIFSGLSQNLTIRILSRLKPEIYRKGELAYKAGDPSDCMYFVSFGTFALYKEDNVEIGHMDDGGHFGDISVLLNIPRYLTAMAVETSLVYRFDSPDFDEIIRPENALLLKMEKNAEFWLRKIQQDLENLKQDARRRESTRRNLFRNIDDDDDIFGDED